MADNQTCATCSRWHEWVGAGRIGDCPIHGMVSALASCFAWTTNVVPYQEFRRLKDEQQKAKAWHALKERMESCDPVSFPWRG